MYTGPGLASMTSEAEEHSPSLNARRLFDRARAGRAVAPTVALRLDTQWQALGIFGFLGWRSARLFGTDSNPQGATTVLRRMSTNASSGATSLRVAGPTAASLDLGRSFGGAGRTDLLLGGVAFRIVPVFAPFPDIAMHVGVVAVGVRRPSFRHRKHIPIPPRSAGDKYSPFRSAICKTPWHPATTHRRRDDRLFAQSRGALRELGVHLFDLAGLVDAVGVSPVFLARGLVLRVGQELFELANRGLMRSK